MAFAASFGLEIVTNAVILGATYLPQTSKPRVLIGCGTAALDATTDPNTGGVMPSLSLYDAHGNQFAEYLGGDKLDAGANPTIEFESNILNPDAVTKSPEYMRIQAHSNDATCIGYVAVTSSGDDHRIWHAGYAMQCADQMSANFWYPSPEIIPGTDFRPGCVWLSRDDRFLQGISFKLTDFGFPTSNEAETAQKQYTEFPNTLCQSPGRMTLWKSIYVLDCIPFYDFTLEKDEKTGFDKDMQKIVDGHMLPCTLDPSSAAYKQELQPGRGPRALTPQQQAAQDAAGEDPNGAPAGAGNFGGTVGSIPANQAAQPSRKAKRSSTMQTYKQQLERSHSILARREQLKHEKDYCVDRLVISHLQEHSAQEVCGMASSWGPDFVSIVEGLYCDMCERELWSLCDNSSMYYCFDLDKGAVRFPSHLAMRDEYGFLPDMSKKFIKVSEWK